MVVTPIRTAILERASSMTSMIGCHSWLRLRRGKHIDYGVATTWAGLGNKEKSVGGASIASS